LGNMDKNIINILIGQHNVLKRQTAGIKTESQKDAADFTAIFAGLKEFEKSFAGHLELENNFFYPNLLRKLESRGVDMREIRKFIDEMKQIEKDVYGFLGKYDTAEKIEKNFGPFEPDLNETIVVLLIRIYSEENGVYLSWED